MRAIVRFSRKGIHIVKKEQNKKKTGPKWRQKIGKLLALFESGPHRSFGCDHQTKKRFKIGLDI